MKMKKIAIAAAIGAASSFAMAGGFDGPFVQLGIGGSSTWTKVSGAPVSDTGADPNVTMSGGSFNGIVAGGYSQDLGIIDPSIKGLNLAANIFYVIGNQSSGSKSASGTDAGGYSNNFSLNGKLKNTFGISVEPGWNFTDNALGYVKLAWLNSRAQSTINFSDNDGNAFGIDGPSSSTVNGFGYGIGAKYLITKNIFAGVDLMGVTYSGISPTYTVPSAYCNSDCSTSPNIKNTQFMGFASIGYKF